MQKIVTFPVADLSYDPGAAADALDRACNTRAHRYRVGGVCQIDELVYFVLRPRPTAAPAETYVLTPVEDLGVDGFPDALLQRWSAGFNPLGTVRLDAGVYLILFAREP